MLPQTALKTLMVIHTLMRECDISWLEEASILLSFLPAVNCPPWVNMFLATQYAKQLRLGE